MDVTPFHSFHNLSERVFPSLLNIAKYRLLSNDVLKEQLERYTSAETVDETISSLFPLVLYFLNCNLPLNYLIERIEEDLLPITSPNELFHLLFQNSVPHLKAILVHHYSFMNPIPFYYPIIRKYSNNDSIKFTLCKEIWYSLTPHKAVMSFGVGAAANKPTGKSTLLDLIFELNFVSNSISSSCFHNGSIDLRLTKNFLAGAQCDSCYTDWAFFDLHGPTDVYMINILLHHIGIVIIHVLQDEIVNNFKAIEMEIRSLRLKDKKVYIFIRDASPNVEHGNLDKNIYSQYEIPNLSKKIVSKKLIIKLKKIGCEVIQNAKMQKFTCSDLEGIIKMYDPQLSQEFDPKNKYVSSIIQSIHKSRMVKYGFLNCYPIFIELVNKKYELSNESDQEKIETLNKDCSHCFDRLNKMRSFADANVTFQKIISDPDAILILWKLAQELQILTRESNIQCASKDQSNDKYSVEILWREAILSKKFFFQNNLQRREEYAETLSRNLSALVGTGEPFELIDGDNLVFFSKEINSMLRYFHVKQTCLIQEFNANNPDNQITEAPLVVSVIGPQSSGKSTLLNYVFGCKFITSTGRCTRGVYGSILELEKPINKSKFLLILDTEGIDAAERKHISSSSSIHFDRSLVLFCLSISNVMIINLKGELNNEMHELLKICAYSLNHPKIHRNSLPKIMFVLNQMADTNLENRIESIRLLQTFIGDIELNKRDELEISEQIELTEDDLFALPTAFDTVLVDKPGEEIFRKEVTSHSTSMNFALNCSSLRKNIFEKLMNDSKEERPYITSISGWFEMAGEIWDTIIKFQDIVKFKNFDELRLDDQLKTLTSELILDHFYFKKNEIQKIVDTYSSEIADFDSTNSSAEELRDQIGQKIYKFEIEFNTRKNTCIIDFKSKTHAQPDSLIYKERLEQLERQISTERLGYMICLRTRATEIYNQNIRREQFSKFKENITSNATCHIAMQAEEQDEEFERLWKESFLEDDLGEVYKEQNLTDFYLMFSCHWFLIPQKEVIELYQKANFDLDKVDELLTEKLLDNLSNSSQCEEPYFYPTRKSSPLKDIQPHYNYSTRLEYLNEDYFYYVHSTEGQESMFLKYFPNSKTIYKYDWVPEECVPLLQSCSGYYSEYDINWKNLSPNKQIVKLVTCFIDSHLKIIPAKRRDGTQPKPEIRLIQHIISETSVPQDREITPVTIMNITDSLYKRLSIFNHEISYIGAELTIHAQRSIGTFVFSKLFRVYFKKKWHLYSKNRSENTKQKKSMKEYFLNKVEISKIIHSNEECSCSNKYDIDIAEKYVKNYQTSLYERIRTEMSNRMDTLLHTHQKTFSNETISQEAEQKLSDYLTTAEVSDSYDHFVVRYFCNRNRALEEIFHRKWDEFTLRNMKHVIANAIEIQQNVLQLAIYQLNDLLLILSKEEIPLLDSRKCFTQFGTQPKECDSFKQNESPYRAMVLYLQIVMNPGKTPEMIQKVFEGEFTCKNVTMKMTSQILLKENILNTTKLKYVFQHLLRENFFESELIFNLHTFLSHFKKYLEKCKFEITEEEFRKILLPVKQRYLKYSLGCNGQCPCCGKFCDQKKGHNAGCYSSMGHQFASMGGKVWGNDKQHSAIFLRCEDYKDNMTVSLPGSLIKWREFKRLTSIRWDWQNDLQASKYETEEKMHMIIKVWDMYGQGILKYHRAFTGVNISFRRYEEKSLTLKSSIISKFLICFVIDGTGSMRKDIDNVIHSVQRLVDLYKETNKLVEFRIVIYRDHCDLNLIETFPNGKSFREDIEAIMRFLKEINTEGGGDVPEASLDGLVEGVKSNWESGDQTRRLIIHLYDAPPHGKFPQFRLHSINSNPEHCCCCSAKCKFDWERDFWRKMKTLEVEYHGINTGEKRWSEFERTMNHQLDYLSKGFTKCGKEQVNDAVMQIFINYQSEDAEAK